jgi:hypothetical protein
MNTEAFVSLFLAIIFVWILYLSFLKALNAAQIKNYKRILTTIAVSNGFLLAIGPTPEVVIAIEISRLTPIISANYPDMVQMLLNIGTVVNLLFGFGAMVSKSGKVGAFAFWLAFVGGYLLPIVPIFATMPLAIAVGFEELSKTSDF